MLVYYYYWDTTPTNRFRFELDFSSVAGGKTTILLPLPEALLMFSAYCCLADWRIFIEFIICSFGVNLLSYLALFMVWRLSLRPGKDVVPPPPDVCCYYAVCYADMAELATIPLLFVLLVWAALLILL